MLRGATVEVDITPPVGVRMAGYTARTGGSEGIHDPLKAQIILLESGKNSVVIATLDLIAVSSEFVGKIRKNLAEKIKIDEQSVLIACVHTHSGPEGFLSGMPFLLEEPNPVLEEITFQKITGAVYWAKRLLQPIHLSSGFDLGAGIGLNRNDPEKGSVDPQLSVLRVDNSDHHPLAVLYNYGCHPTVMGSDNYLISADFPGAARQQLHKIFPDTIFMFCNGGSGDVSTRFSRRKASFDEVDRLGGLVAASVIKAMNTSENCKNLDLCHKTAKVELPIREFTSESQVKQSIAEMKDSLEILKKKGEPPGELRKLVTKIEGAEIQLLLSASFSHQKTVSAEIQALVVGDFRLYAIPGEPFSNTVIAIKEHFKPDPVMVISYANGYVGYLPEPSAGKSSTYEDFVSPYTHQAAQIIKETIFSQLGNLHG